MNAWCETYFSVETDKGPIFMPTSMYQNAKAAPENLRSWRTLAHQNFPDHWGKTLEIYNFRNWWRIGIEGDIRI